jgi:hypothetical protein
LVLLASDISTLLLLGAICLTCLIGGLVCLVLAWEAWRK